MFGTREAFPYFECADCGCVQIAEIPALLADHYPDTYFSFRGFHSLAAKRWRRIVDTHRAGAALGKPSLLGSWANRVARPLDFLAWITHMQLDQSASVLDVGCGGGKLLVRMKLAGFRVCEGLDPFIPESIRYANGVIVHRQSLKEFALRTEQKFDLVMFHHSLEHLPDQAVAIESANKLLSPNGWILIRVPVSDCVAFERYRESWVQLDPPRHLYLHTRRSMDSLVAPFGLRVQHSQCDSTQLQFIGSELYLRDIPLTAARKRKRVFTKEQLDVFRNETRRVNAANLGDQAVFYLRAA